MTAITAMTGIAAYEELHAQVEELQALPGNDTNPESMQSQEAIQEEVLADTDAFAVPQNDDLQSQAGDDERSGRSESDLNFGAIGDFTQSEASGAESAGDLMQPPPLDGAPLPIGIDHRSAPIDPRGDRRREQRQRQRQQHWPEQE